MIVQIKQADGTDYSGDWDTAEYRNDSRMRAWLLSEAVWEMPNGGDVELLRPYNERAFRNLRRKLYERGRAQPGWLRAAEIDRWHQLLRILGNLPLYGVRFRDVQDLRDEPLGVPSSYEDWVVLDSLRDTDVSDRRSSIRKMERASKELRRARRVNSRNNRRKT